MTKDTTIKHAHDPVCFVAMPSGRTPAEKVEYTGWYEEVYKPVIEATAKLTPHLCMTSRAPVSINEEILRHLVRDQVAIFDLAGLAAGTVPNPNVMYELGVRHAFGLSAVLFGWEDQQLPFDVAPQRAVLLPRTLGHARVARERLADALTAAMKGEYHKPFEAVSVAVLLDEQAKHTPALELLTQRIDGLQRQVEAQRRYDRYRRPAALSRLEALQRMHSRHGADSTASALVNDPTLDEVLSAIRSVSKHESPAKADIEMPASSDDNSPA